MKNKLSFPNIAIYTFIAMALIFSATVSFANVARAEVAIINSPANNSFINTNTVSVDFTVSDNFVQCKLNLDSYADCSSPHNLTNLSDGVHTFAIQSSVDGIASTTTSISFTVDKIFPTITVNPFDSTTPTNQDITVTVITNEGTLDFDSHTFVENGSFNFTATDESGNSTTETVTISNIDKIAPEITLIGQNSVNVEFGSNYIDDGATALDLADGDITSSITIDSTVNTSVVGVYTVTYNVSDLANNNAIPVIRTVNVVDTTDPVITAPIEPQSFQATGASTEPTLVQATAVDTVDSNPTISYEPHTFNVGTHTVTWTATDASRNSSTVTSQIEIIDSTPPTISSHENLTVEATSASGATVNYTNPTATDLVDGNVDVDCTPTNDSLFSIGTTPVICSATDSLENQNTLEFTVTVEDTTAPIINVIGGISTTTITMEVGDTYTDQGATASDIVDGDITLSITIDSTVNTSVVGVYTVTYNVSDLAGNIAVSSTRIVNVIDTTDPTITAPENIVQDMNNTLSTSVILGSPIVSDIGDSSPEVTNDAPSLFPLGTTTVIWTATDASGNSATAEQVVVITDITAPSLSITSTSLTNDNTPTITGTTDDNTSDIVVTINENDYTVEPENGVWSKTTDTLSDNPYTISVSSTDIAGNIGNASGNIVVDTTSPTISSYLPSVGALDIALKNYITLTFDEAVNVNNSNITFNPSFTDFTVADSGTNVITIIPNNNLSSNTEYSVSISGITDLAGNTMNSTHNEIDFTTITTYNIPLYHSENNSWNLISLPVTPLDSDIVDVLGNAKDSIDTVWTYDPSNPNSINGWLTYSPNDPEATNNLSSMKSGYGYWINANNDSSISGLGTLLSVGPNLPASRTLGSGWNLIGYYQLQEENSSTPNDAFASLGGSYSALWGFQNDGGTFKNVSLNDTILPGEGFWISLPQEKEYTPSNN